MRNTHNDVESKPSHKRRAVECSRLRTSCIVFFRCVLIARLNFCKESHSKWLLLMIFFFCLKRCLLLTSSLGFIHFFYLLVNDLFSVCLFCFKYDIVKSEIIIYKKNFYWFLFNTPKKNTIQSSVWSSCLLFLIIIKMIFY